MTFQNKKVLVVAKTYPNLSKKYDRTVCTAGIDLTTNSWIRIFPIRFFELPFLQRPKKYDVMDINVEPRADKFMRKESHKTDDSSINILYNISTANNWEGRKQILLPLLNNSVEELEVLYQKDHTSLGIIKPKRIMDFKVVPIEECRDWEKDLIEGRQKTLFGEYHSPLEKIPYKFSYVFKCNTPDCRTHDMMIEDWELCQLYRAERQKFGESVALQKVRQKYFDDFASKDIHLIMGTESNWNKWLIIGVFYPKLEA